MLYGYDFPLNIKLMGKVPSASAALHDLDYYPRYHEDYQEYYQVEYENFSVHGIGL
jgi:hypothetical protein